MTKLSTGNTDNTTVPSLHSRNNSNPVYQLYSPQINGHVPTTISTSSSENLTHDPADQHEPSEKPPAVLDLEQALPAQQNPQQTAKPADSSMEMTGRVNGYVDSPQRGRPMHQGGGDSVPSQSEVNLIHQSELVNKVGNPMYGMTPNNGMDAHVYEDLTEGAVEYYNDNGPHREMAVDVPQGFVGTVKEPPRYPRPGNSNNSLPKQPPSTPSRGSDIHADKYSTDANLSAAAMVASQPQLSKAEQAERIRKYQEELRKRREEEERLFAEQEFLRTSLRGSKKLQALEQGHRAAPVGFENPSFMEEDEANAAEVASKSATLPIRHKDHTNKYLKKPVAIEDLFSSLQHIQSKLQSAEDQQDVWFLSRLFHNSAFQQAVHVHNKVLEVACRSPPPEPVCTNAQELADDVLRTVVPTGSSKYCDDLSSLLQGPQVKNLLFAHDKIAEQNQIPEPEPLEEMRDSFYDRVSHYGEETIKVVRLQKSNDPLGATVRNDGDQVIVGRIVKGGAAEKSDKLHEGDEILEVNGVDMRGKNVNDVCDIISQMTGTLTFLIIPAQPPYYPPVTQTNNQQTVHIKAHFNYDPEDDLYIPCRELGISFGKGDILHVINQQDTNWWQAYREGEEDQALAGLIPSRTFQEQREAMKQTIIGDGKENNKKGGKCTCRRNKKKNKQKLYNAQNEELDAEEILTYEEMAMYYPQPNRKRPVVLIGPPNVGRHELRQRLMETDPDRFAAAVPHTSRPRKDQEADGKDYHFVPRHVFEADIRAHQFVEYGEFEKNFYGTSLAAIRQVVNSGKICILNLHPQSLRILKASDLKPYIVFVAPPNLENLKRLRKTQGLSVDEDELKDIVEKAREMEENFGHYFDLIIVYFDSNRAYTELLTEINRLEVEPQWVPSSWMK